MLGVLGETSLRFRFDLKISSFIFLGLALGSQRMEYQQQLQAQAAQHVIKQQHQKQFRGVLEDDALRLHAVRARPELRGAVGETQAP